MDINLKLRSGLLGGAATALALAVGAAGVAQAQQAAPAKAGEEEVIVTGIRASIASSANAKRTSDQIVEVVTAEDIGKLPDVSIAESLARLPGLAIQRLDGRGQQLSIRGLGPDFTTALLNGREQVTVGDNRGVEFDQYPSELLSSVVVYKTPEAGLVGQGLMGTVDMRTMRPLKNKERVLALGARYEWNSKGALNSDADDKGYRLSFTYADKFMNDTLGVAIGVSSINTPTQSERFNAWGYPDAGPGGSFLIGGSKSYVQSNELKRTGAIGIIEYAPTDTFRTSVDMYYSNFDENVYLRGIELPLAWSSASLAPGATVQDRIVTAGTFNGVKGVIRNDRNSRQADLWSAGWNTEWKFAEKWTAKADLSYSTVTRDDRYLETYSGTGAAGSGATDALGFRLTPGEGTRFSPTLNYGNFNTIFLTSPQGWGTDTAAGRPFGQAGFDNRPTIEDTLTAFRASAVREFESGPISKLEIGANYATREKSKVANEFFLAVPGGAATAVIPTSLRLGTTNLGFLGLGNMVSYNPVALVASGGLTATRNSNADVVTKSWAVDEDVTTFYVKADLNGSFGDIEMRGNAGLQFVNTDQSSTGAVGSNGFFRNVSLGDKYDHILPSLNLIFDLNNNTYVRFAASKTLARARMEQLRASQELQRNAGNATSTNPFSAYFSSDGGNPKLRPYEATGVDLSVERYFGKGGYVAFAAYYKQLDNWVFGSFPEVFDFSAFRIPSDPAIATTLGARRSPQNLSGGWINGLEASISVPFELIAKPLEGFGATVSGSYANSKIEPIPGVGIPVPGLSRSVVNATLYYDRNGVQARVSARNRGEFLGEVNGFGGGRDLRLVQEETIVDAQLGYEFQAGALKGLNLTLQGMNLTDEPFATNVGDERLVIDYQKYGPTYMFGVSKKF
ncbi:MAG: TonB-dependent receptor [Caulobacterales bacterium]